MTEVYTELLEENSELEAKILRLEQENKELKAYKDVNEDFKKAWDELNKKYTEVLKLAKENADSNEYCLQELEKENEELNAATKAALEEVEQMKKNPSLGKSYTNIDAMMQELLA